MNTNRTRRLSLVFTFLIASVTSYTQSITKNTISPVNGTVCPGAASYSVSIPNNIGLCSVKWVPTDGVVNGRDNQKDVSITWNDTPGATATLKVTFSNCESGNPNEGVSSSLSELILSVKNQSFGSYNNAITIDYCTKKSVTVEV